MRALTLAEALRYGRGVERSFLCPEHGDSRPSASVNIIKGKWYCYTCHAHGTLSGEALLAEPDYQQMKLWLDNKLAEGQIYPESWLSRYDAGPVHPYWLERVGEAAARAFRLGFGPGGRCRHLPAARPTPAGYWASYVGLWGMKDRSTSTRMGVDVGRLLFHYTPDHREAVVLVEGALDAIALWNVGVDAFAIYGSRLSVDQVRLIDRIDPERIYTAYDMDDAGWEAYRMTEQAFKHRLVTRLTWPQGLGQGHRRDR